MLRSIRPMRPGRKEKRTNALRPIVCGASHAVPTSPADLTNVVDAWPQLPEAIKAGIIAMVRATET
jgi:hypothetical protein